MLNKKSYCERITAHNDLENNTLCFQYRKALKTTFFSVQINVYEMDIYYHW